MSKELTPLEADKQLFGRYGRIFSQQDYERHRVIRNALKDYERIKKDYGVDFIKQILREPDDLKYKKLKALEIIKELILTDLVFDDEEQAINFSFGISTLCIKIRDKEKYELLKEVLL